MGGKKFFTAFLQSRSERKLSRRISKTVGVVKSTGEGTGSF
jgi:hypothetical protein